MKRCPCTTAYFTQRTDDASSTASSRLHRIGITMDMAASLARRAASSTWPGAPSLIFVGDMTDLFHEARSTEIIGRVCATVAVSAHIGLLLTKRTHRMAEYFANRHLRTLRRWQPKLWLGFSAERQGEFDARWQDMRLLADAGWLVFVSIAPMIRPAKLPPDFLALRDRRWVIVAGEQGPHRLCRDMHPNWARAIRDQCVASGIPFFMKQMARKEPIPPDLLVRQFPQGGRHDERYPFGAA